MTFALSARPSAALSTRRASATRAAGPLRAAAPGPRRVRSVPVAAATKDDGVVAAAKNIGLNPEEGIFGFTPFAEVRILRRVGVGVGRVADESSLSGRGEEEKTQCSVENTPPPCANGPALASSRLSISC